MSTAGILTYLRTSVYSVQNPFSSMSSSHLQQHRVISQSELKLQWSYMLCSKRWTVSTEAGFKARPTRFSQILLSPPHAVHARIHLWVRPPQQTLKCSNLYYSFFSMVFINFFPSLLISFFLSFLSSFNSHSFLALLPYFVVFFSILKIIFKVF